MPEPSSLSLWKIDETLSQLMTMREEVSTDEERLAIDSQIQVWIEQELRKFDACFGFIRSEEAKAEAAKQVAREAVHWQHVHENRALRVRELTKQVMERGGIRRVEGPGVGSFTVRTNGGAQPLDIFDERQIPDTFKSVELQIPKTTWLAIQLLLEDEGPILRVLLSGAKEYVDGKRVRAALEKGETVDGARLAERGTSLMIR